MWSFDCNPTFMKNIMVIKFSYIDRLPAPGDMVIHSHGGYIPKYVESATATDIKTINYTTRSLISGEMCVISEHFCYPIDIHACESVIVSELKKGDTLLQWQTGKLMSFERMVDSLTVGVIVNGFFELHPVNTFVKVSHTVDWQAILKEHSKDKNSQNYILAYSKINHHEKSRI